MLYQQGMNQQTPAVQNTLTTLRKADGTMGTSRGPRRRRRKTAKATGKRRATRRASSKRAKPAKGSAAMKRRMAKLRRMRKK